MSLQHVQTRLPMLASTNISRPPIPVTVRLLDGVVRPVAPLGPVWGSVVRPDELRALADLVSRSLETPRLREHLAHWIVEREARRREEAKIAKARSTARREKERQKTGGTRTRKEGRRRAPGAKHARRWKIAMPPRAASAAVVYAAFSRAAGSDSARRAAYRFGRQSVCAAERAVDELVDREYLRLRAGAYATSVAHFEAALDLREGEELDTLEKVYIVINVRKAILNSPLDVGSHDDEAALVSEGLADSAEADSDDPYEDHYWTPDEDGPNREMLEVVASSSLESLKTLAEHFDPLGVGLALVRPGALDAYLESARKIVLGRGKARGGPGVLGKPDRPWYDAMYDLSRAISIVGQPHTSKQGSRASKANGPTKTTGRSAHRPGQNSDAYRRKLFLGMHDLADERHGEPTPGDHRLIDRLRDDGRPVLWTAKALRRRRSEDARTSILHAVDSHPSGTAFSVAEIVERSGIHRARVREMIEALILEGAVRRLNHNDSV